MKKLILATIACAFIANPAIAEEFTVEQTKMIEQVTAQIENSKDDSAKMDFLTQKKACMEKAKDIDGLKECLATFPPLSN